MTIEEEYERIKGLFDGVDENQLALLDGAIVEAARLRTEFALPRSIHAFDILPLGRSHIIRTVRKNFLFQNCSRK